MSRLSIRRTGLCCVNSVGSPFPKHNTFLRRGGADGPNSPFHVLGLLERKLHNLGGPVHRRRYGGLVDETTPTAVRQFEDCTLPLLVDVGCGAGRFALLAGHHGRLPLPVSCAHYAGQRINVLGLDQHKQLMDRGNVWAEALGLQGRVAFLPVSVQLTSLSTILEGYQGPVVLLAVQNPDPHYRADRHVVTASFAKECARVVAPGGSVLLTSDVRDTAKHMRAVFAEHVRDALELHPLHAQPGQLMQDEDNLQGTGDPYLPLLPPQRCPVLEHVLEHGGAGHTGKRFANSGWLKDNPLGWPTEREEFARLVTKSPVYRMLLQRR